MKIYINGRFLTQKMTGVNRFAYEMCKSLLENNRLNVKIVCPHQINQEYNIDKFSIRYWGVGKSHLWEQVILPFFFLFKNEYLLINFSGLGPLFFKKQYITIHDVSFWNYPDWFSKLYYYYYRILTPIIAKRSKHVLTVSEFSKKEIMKFINVPENKISILYNGVSQSFFSLQSDSSNYKRNNKYILSIGSIEPRKNFNKLIEAYELLNIDIDLIIIGKKNKIFKNLVLPTKKNLHFVNHLTDTDLINYYKNATLFIYPSLYEGFGLPPLEAIAAGCPTIVSDIEVFHEIFDDSVLYFNPNDSVDICKCIELVLSNIGLDPELEKSRKKILKKYNWSLTANKLIEIINNTYL